MLGKSQVRLCDQLPVKAPLATPLLSLIQRENYSCSLFVRNTLYPFPSRPTEGRIAIVTDAGWDAMDAAVTRVI
jgi:hypothetical protein